MELVEGKTLTETIPPGGCSRLLDEIPEDQLTREPACSKPERFGSPGDRYFEHEKERAFSTLRASGFVSVRSCSESLLFIGKLRRKVLVFLP